MNRHLTSLLAAVAVAAGAVTAQAAVINDTESLLQHTYTIIDTVAARNAYTEFEAQRAAQLEGCNTILEGLKTIPMHYGRKATEAELLSLKSLMEYPATQSLPDFEAVTKEAAKGKIHKSLEAVTKPYTDHLRATIKKWSDSVMPMASLPTIEVKRDIINRWYRPANVRNYTVLDSIDRATQLEENWQWINTHRSKLHEQQYPFTFSYLKYDSHPGMKVIGDFVFDDDGNLLYVTRLARREPQIADRGSLTWKGVNRLIARMDYEANRYSIKDEGETVNAILRARLGIDDNPELAEQINMTADNWYTRVVNDHVDEFEIIYRIDRIDDTTFNILFLNSKGESTWQLQFKYNSLQFDVERHVSRLRQAPDVTVELNYSRPQLPGPSQPFYLFAEEPARYPGGEAALEAWVQKEKWFDSKGQLVVVAMNVDAEGNISNIHAIRNIGPQVNAEAERIAGQIEKLEPARVNNVPVASVFYLPVRF